MRDRGTREAIRDHHRFQPRAPGHASSSGPHFRWFPDAETMRTGFAATLAPPSGTRDFLPEQFRFRERNLAIIKRALELSGFEPIETPAFERLDTLVGKYGQEGEKLIFKILRRGELGKSGEADLALRYDLTVPLARVYARHRGQLLPPFKRYQIGPVWRADRPGRGRYRELFQCDIDIVGSGSLLAEVEILLTLAAAYRAVGLEGVVFHLNSRLVIDALLQAYAVPPEQRKRATIALDKLDKIGVDGVCKELAANGLAPDTIDRIGHDLTAQDAGEVVRSRVSDIPLGRDGLAAIEEVQRLFGAAGETGSSLIFAPFLARGLDYYTGCIWEAYHEALPAAIGSGGRYDNLIGDLAGGETPAVGGSIGIERVLLLLESSQKPKPARSCDVMVTVWDAAGYADALAIVGRLRRTGIRTEPFLGTENLSAQLRHAAKRGVLCVVLRGPEEVAAGEVALKLLGTGEQRRVALSSLEEEVCRAVGESCSG
jgi:histidyl-tRNA synthetase